jgi:hypothetical protein
LFCRPRFAHEKTVPVAAFLSLFIGKHAEIQVSQSFNDGNLDVQWKRGVVFTAKLEGLWQPASRVTAEEVRHLRNRVEEFHVHAVLGDGGLKEVETCAPCMARWICKYSDEFDATPLRLSAPALRPAATGSLAAFAAVEGFADLATAARLADGTAAELFEQVLNMGAVHVAELRASDWEQLPRWASLRVLERRRLVQALSSGPLTVSSGA